MKHQQTIAAAPSDAYKDAGAGRQEVTTGRSVSRRVGGIAWQRARILRLRAVQPRIGADLRAAVLPVERSEHGPDRELRRVLPRLRDPACGRHHLRDARRPLWTQVRPDGDDPADGHRQHAHRPAAHLCERRRLGADPAGGLPPAAGTGSGRGAGRRRRADGRVRASRSVAAISPRCHSWACCSGP